MSEGSRLRAASGGVFPQSEGRGGLGRVGGSGRRGGGRRKGGRKEGPPPAAPSRSEGAERGEPVGSRAGRVPGASPELPAGGDGHLLARPADLLRGPGGRERRRVGYAALERPECGERTLCAGCRWGRRHRSEQRTNRKSLPGSLSVECAGGSGRGSGRERWEWFKELCAAGRCAGNGRGRTAPDV